MHAQSKPRNGTWNVNGLGRGTQRSAAAVESTLNRYFSLGINTFSDPGQWRGSCSREYVVISDTESPFDVTEVSRSTKKTDAARRTTNHTLHVV